MAASGDGSGYLLTLVSPMFISTQKRRLKARHMSVPLQPQIFAAMAFVTHWVKCAAVGTPDRSRTCQERSASIAFCRIKDLTLDEAQRRLVAELAATGKADYHRPRRGPPARNS